MKKTGFLLSDSVFPGGKSHSVSEFGVAWFTSFSGNNLDGAWGGSDSFVAFFVHGFHGFTVNTVFDVLTELLAVSFFVVLLELGHVLSDVATEDVFAVGFGVEFVFLGIVTWKSFGRVRNIKSTVDGSLEGTENFVTGGGSGETGVQKASEWTWTFVGWFNVVFISVDFFLSFVDGIELHLGEKSSGEEETGAVVSGVVGEAGLDSEFRELVGVSGTDNNISAHPWVGDLADDIPVGGSDDQPIFRGVELVLVLGTEASSCLVIGFTFLPPLEFRLKSLEVGLVFLDLNQSINSLLSSVSVLSGHFGLKTVNVSVISVSST
jgi:hypothetical protein